MHLYTCDGNDHRPATCGALVKNPAPRDLATDCRRRAGKGPAQRRNDVSPQGADLRAAVSDIEQCSIPISADSPGAAKSAPGGVADFLLRWAGVLQAPGGVQPIDPFAHPMTDSGDAIAAPDAEILHA
jgi:hypothetical protein